jgi:hypothetical protein
MFNILDDEHEVSEWKLTENELKSISGFENITSEEAEEVINAIAQLALIAYKCNIETQ